ncbi:MAG: VIT domain-containing protein [Planctomycetaceae bacterium]
MQVQFALRCRTTARLIRATLLVDGKELPGELMARDKARSRYEEIVRKSQDPALLEWMVGTGCFKRASFPSRPESPARSHCTTTRFCVEGPGSDRLSYPLSTAKYPSAGSIPSTFE